MTEVMVVGPDDVFVERKGRDRRKFRRHDWTFAGPRGFIDTT